MVKTGSDLYFHNFIEISGFVPATMQDRWVAGEKIAAAFMEHFPAKQVTITPHAPYSVSPGLLETIQKYESRKLLSMHLLESEEEIQFFKEKQGDFLKLYAQLGISLDFFIPAGKDSLRQYWPIMKNHAPWLWVHNTEMGKHDLEWLNEQGLDWNQIYFCLCPQANEYINSAMPSIHRFRHQYPMQLCLGTDSLAGNYCLSMVFEMRLLQKKGHLSDLEFLLQMATLNGAKALGIHNQFGSFEKGKMPGIVLLEGVDGEILTPKAKASRLS
jgi:cytosine/adenosine deaminase-related metal-dependent hydrolase